MKIPDRLQELYDAASTIELLILPGRAKPTLVLVTGSRKYTDLGVVAAVLRGLSSRYGRLHITHGAAAGLDATARHVARSLEAAGWTEKGFPADWSRFKGSAGPRRNIQMLEQRKHDICIGWPMFDSIGTYDMLTRAFLAGLPTFMVVEAGITTFEERDCRPLWPYGRDIVESWS